MRKLMWVTAVVAVAVLGVAVAQAPAPSSQAPSASAQAPSSQAPATPSAKPAEKQATVTGQVQVKTEMIGGKQEKVPYISVSEAKTESGQAIAGIKGSTLKVTGSKVAEVQNMNGKHVEVKGNLEQQNKTIDVASVSPAKPSTMAAAPSRQRASRSK